MFAWFKRVIPGALSKAPRPHLAPVPRDSPESASPPFPGIFGSIVRPPTARRPPRSVWEPRGVGTLCVGAPPDADEQTLIDGILGIGPWHGHAEDDSGNDGAPRVRIL